MKISYAAVLVLALPVSLVAQQPSGGPPANPITAVFRGRTMGLQRNLAQAFDSIPEAKFGYRPTRAQQTIGYIAQVWPLSNVTCARDRTVSVTWPPELRASW